MSVERPISAVLNDIVRNVQDIVRSELRLAKTEVKEDLGKSRTAAILIVAGVLMLGVSALFGLLAIVYALSEIMEPWAAALIVAVGEGLMAAICVALGVKKLKTLRGVPKTTATLKENVEWAKQATR